MKRDNTGEGHECRMDTQTECLKDKQQEQRQDDEQVTHQNGAVTSDIEESVADHAFEGVDQQVENGTECEESLHQTGVSYPADDCNCRSKYLWHVVCGSLRHDMRVRFPPLKSMHRRHRRRDDAA